MLKYIKDGLYNRNILIGVPKVTLKNFKCQNITCGKRDQFKKYKNGYICECGYITFENHEVEEVHNVKLYCKAKKCPFNKNKMNKECLRCEYIYEK